MDSDSFSPRGEGKAWRSFLRSAAALGMNGAHEPVRKSMSHIQTPLKSHLTDAGVTKVIGGSAKRLRGEDTCCPMT